MLKTINLLGMVTFEESQLKITKENIVVSIISRKKTSKFNRKCICHDRAIANCKSQIAYISLTLKNRNEVIMPQNSHHTFNFIETGYVLLTEEEMNSYHSFFLILFCFTSISFVLYAQNVYVFIFRFTKYWEDKILKNYFIE